jgi:acyl-CoA synthetase (AMP-forming)/AMP-acid ligase II
MALRRQEGDARISELVENLKRTGHPRESIVGHVMRAVGSKAAARVQRIASHRAQHLAPYKRVRRIEFVFELPKTISGKIRRVELRQLEVQRRQGDGRAALEFFEEDFPQLKG